MNTELFRKIDDRISAEPDGFDMYSWENQNAVCGTTRCAAGWAIYLTTGKPLFSPDHTLHDSVNELAERLGLDSRRDSISDIADRLLGLNGEGRHFFHTDDETGAEFIALAAEGREAEALALLGEH